MIEVHPRLFIGTEHDYEAVVRNQPGWWVVHACKEPYHRQLLGYRSRGAPKGHPEYFLAVRGTRLFLNLVDADDPAYIPKQIIDTALAFVDKGLSGGGRVLVHCNQGESRAPSIGLLYMAARAGALPRSTLDEAEARFRQLYPGYNPKGGIRGFLRANWGEYVK